MSISWPRAVSMMIGRSEPSPRRHLADLETGHLRQHDVEDHQVRWIVARHLQTGLAVARQRDLVALVDETVAQGDRHRLVVFDDQDSVHAVSPRGRSSGRWIVNVLPPPTSLSTATRPP